MYQIGVCDDEPVFLHYITRMVKEIYYQSGIECEVRMFSNVWAVEAYIRSGKPLDLLLLDIIMGRENGMHFAQSLRDNDNQLPIIFITSTMDFVLDGYMVDSLGYITKPVNQNVLKKNLMRAWEKYKKQAMSLSNPSQSISFQLDDVLYVDVQDKLLTIHLADGNTLTITMTLSSLRDKLPAEQFVQCHRGFIVSLPAISSICRYEIELKNKERIPVSKSHYSNVQNALINWAVLQ